MTSAGAADGPSGEDRWRPKSYHGQPWPRAGPQANAGPHPGRGPGCPAGGPEHTPLAGRGDGPDRRPGPGGARTTRPRGPGKEAPASRPATGSLPPGGPCHEAVRAPGHAAPVHRRQGRSRASRSPTSGNCSRAGLLARTVVLERDFQPGRTAVILARQPSPRASPVTLIMCPGTPLRPTVGTAPKPPASLAVPCW
jgi:hypothetical protein